MWQQLVMLMYAKLPSDVPQALALQADGDLRVSDADAQVILTNILAKLNAGITVSATDLDIRNLTFAQDKVDASGSTVELGVSTLAALESINVQNTVTVQATDLDVRNLTFAQDKVDASGSVIALDVATLAALETINVGNGAGAAAVNIQDGGNSITVDGAVTVGGTVELGVSTLAALESINVQNTVTVQATDLDIRNLTFAQDKVDASGSIVALDVATLAALETINVQQSGTWTINTVPANDEVSTANSFDGVLGIGATAATTIEDLNVYNGLRVSLSSTQQVTVTVAWYSDLAGTKNIANEDTYTIPAGAKKTFTFGRGGRYGRVLLVGGAAASTVVMETTRLRVAQKWSSHSLIEDLPDATDAIAVTSVLKARDETAATPTHKSINGRTPGDSMDNPTMALASLAHLAFWDSVGPPANKWFRAKATRDDGLLVDSGRRMSQRTGRTGFQFAVSRTTVGTQVLRTPSGSKKLYITFIGITAECNKDTPFYCNVLDNANVVHLTRVQPRLVALTALGAILGTQQIGTVSWASSFGNDPIELSSNLTIQLTTFAAGDGGATFIIKGYEE